MTWAVAEDFPDKVKKAVIANVPHTSVFSAVVRSSFRQMRRSLYIGKVFFFVILLMRFVWFTAPEFQCI